MPSEISLIISGLALTISAITAWLTFFRRGTVRMTQPTTIFLGPDSSDVDDGPQIAKIYLRTLLYCTAKRGRIIESMWLRVRRGETTQTFNIWVHGDDKLTRGSGLFVGENGVVCNHNFLPPEDAKTFQFLAGDYVIEVFATLVGSPRPLTLGAFKLHLAEQLATRINSERDVGAFFDWGPDSQRYLSHAHQRRDPKLRLSIDPETKR